MTFQTGMEHEHLAKIAEVLANDRCDAYGAFVWQEDLFVKENGVYIPKARLVLPMTIEGRDPAQNKEGLTGIAFTAFNQTYFDGEPADAQGHNCFCDWYPNGEAVDIETCTGGMVITTPIYTRNPYLAVIDHKENVLHDMDILLETARDSGDAKLELLVKRILIE